MRVWTPVEEILVATHRTTGCPGPAIDAPLRSVGPLLIVYPELGPTDAFTIDIYAFHDSRKILEQRLIVVLVFGQGLEDVFR
jgi:hypothetical protein